MEKAGEEAGERKENRGGGVRSCSCMISDVVGEYLLVEILRRLPMDQIFRCKSVCKYWLSLVENPLFAAEYTKKKEKKKHKRKKKMSCILETHPQQLSPILTPRNIDHDGGERKKLEFSLDFVPDFAQLHGDTKYCDLVQLEAVHRKRQWGAPNYYTFRELILGSSNGLLLCAPLLRPLVARKPRLSIQQAFDGFAPIYVICNPHTKQWLQVPPPDTCAIFSHEIAHVGLVSDFDSNGVCWFKIVRLPLDFDSEGRRSLDLQVFSSRSWEWTAVKVPSLPHSIGPDDRLGQAIVAVTLKKNGEDCCPRLCWMFKGSQTMVYDPINNVVDVIRPLNFRTVAKVVLDGICVSKGQLWAGKMFGGKLRIYRASGNEWEMVKEFDLATAKINWKEHNPVQQRIRIISANLFVTRNPFVTMNPDDPEQVYLSYCSWFALLDMRRATLKFIAGLASDLKPSAIMCDNPIWPTQLPSPFPSSS